MGWSSDRYTIPNPRVLDDPGVLNRLYYISQALHVPEPELLEAMDRAMEADPELDHEYALYAVVFDRLKIPKNRAYHSVQYRDDKERVKVVISRKGVLAPQPGDRDPRYQDRKPRVRLRSGEKMIWPSPYVSATRDSRTVVLEVKELPASGTPENPKDVL